MFLNFSGLNTWDSSQTCPHYRSEIKDFELIITQIIGAQNKFTTTFKICHYSYHRLSSDLYLWISKVANLRIWRTNHSLAGLGYYEISYVPASCRLCAGLVAAFKFLRHNGRVPRDELKLVSFPAKPPWLRRYCPYSMSSLSFRSSNGNVHRQ